MAVIRRRWHLFVILIVRFWHEKIRFEFKIKYGV